MMAKISPKVKEVEPSISSQMPYESRFIQVRGSRIHYVESGEGSPILLVHGNPTSSYLWRNVIPRLKQSGRVIAVDLISMGKSDKLEGPLSFEEHAAYLTGFIEAMQLEGVTLVLHDWGGALGLDYHAQHPDNVEGIVMMEALVRPMNWRDASFGESFIFRRLRGERSGRRLLEKRNGFVETLLPMMAGRSLSAEEMAHYQAPYPTESSRQVVSQWPKEIPIDGTPVSNHQRIGANYDVLVQNKTPVLFLHGEPGMLFKNSLLDDLQREIPRAEVQSVGPGLHYLQETQPTAIGDAVANWLERRRGAQLP